MGFFDGMKNQRELEVCFKKMISAFISIAEDTLEEEERLKVETEIKDQGVVTSPAIPSSCY